MLVSQLAEPLPTVPTKLPTAASWQIPSNCKPLQDKALPGSKLSWQLASLPTCQLTQTLVAAHFSG
ncbi:hypothetical protein ACO7_400084 [Thiomonas arsenitoxydans]|nr:hypothetical protein THICB6_120093 [Thiomonas arsenitoxydans]CQR34601.1 hypothetical protein ACO7_400084 [Thiomonas arsenitoxydans]CQR34666.1 hypothetical protein ACO3_410083 [Thiomonas arsenitoxydans]